MPDQAAVISWLKNSVRKTGGRGCRRAGREVEQGSSGASLSPKRYSLSAFFFFDAFFVVALVAVPLLAVTLLAAALPRRPRGVAGPRAARSANKSSAC